MARITDVTTLGDKVIQQAVAHYGKMPQPLQKCHKPVLRKALRISKGNFHRITVEEDGSLIVWNYAVW